MSDDNVRYLKVSIKCDNGREVVISYPKPVSLSPQKAVKLMAEIGETHGEIWGWDRNFQQVVYRVTGRQGQTVRRLKDSEIYGTMFSERFYMHQAFGKPELEE